MRAPRYPNLADSAASTPGATANNLANTSANLPMSSQMDRDTRTFRETVGSQQATMEQVAADTGGKAFLNSNGLEEAIKTAVDEGSHYYTFSYTPTNRRYDALSGRSKSTWKVRATTSPIVAVTTPSIPMRAQKIRAVRNNALAWPPCSRDPQNRGRLCSQSGSCL